MSSPVVRRARTETFGSIRTRSELVLKSRIACDPKPGINRGDTSASPTAAAATRRAPLPALGSKPRGLPRAGPHGPPALHPAQPVGEDHRQGRDQEGDPVERADHVLEDRVRERDQRERRDERQERAPRAERERVRREHRRPDRRDAGQQQRVERRASAPPALRACSPTRVARVGDRLQGVQARQAVPGGLREDEQVRSPQTSATALATVASTRLRRSSAHAIRAETRPATRIRYVEAWSSNTRAERERRGGREEQRGDERGQTLRTSGVPWVRAIVPSVSS